MYFFAKDLQNLLIQEQRLLLAPLAMLLMLLRLWSSRNSVAVSGINPASQQAVFVYVFWDTVLCRKHSTLT